jgi:hypothetical protein
MSAPTERRRAAWTRAVLRRLHFAIGVALCFSSCRGAESPTGGETHFLTTCHDSAQCGDDLSCVCGVCTRACTDDEQCAELAVSECVTPLDPASCTEGPAAHCDATCSRDADCRAISASHRCILNVCRSGPTIPNDCTTGAVEANEVLVVGDAFFGATHQITAYLETFARSTGALATGERYRDQSSTLNNSLAMGDRGIPTQYADAQAEAPIDVVIMNGGGADALIADCADATNCQPLIDAASALEALFARMATDGVSHVVYAFYPDPTDSALRGKIDVLRTLVEPLCSESPVPCHFVDLRTTVADRAQQYLAPDGLTPTAAGAEAIAAAIWGTMQRECIAQ